MKPRKVVIMVELKSAKKIKDLKESMLGVTEPDDRYPDEELLQVQVNVVKEG